MSKQEIIYIVIALFFILALLVLIFIFAPKTKLKINYIFSLALIFIIFLTYKGCNSLALSNSIVSNNFWDLNAVYKENGFIYCFSTTLLNNGVSKPESYSQNSIESILYSLNDSKTVNSKAPYSDISYSSDEKFPNNDEAQYLDALKSIEYDILAGNEYLYNYISKPVATNLKFGSKSNVWWSSSFISNPNLINNDIKLNLQVT